MCVFLRRNRLFKIIIYFIQVYVRYVKCSFFLCVICNCVVVIKLGDDVIIFIGCNGGGLMGMIYGYNIFDFLFYCYYNYYYYSFSYMVFIVVVLYKNGQFILGIYIRRYGCGQKYEVR